MASVQSTIVDDGLLTVAQAAEFLQLSRTTLYEAMNRGELRYCKFGRSRRVPKIALVEFAAAALTGGWAMAPHLGCRAVTQANGK